MDWSWMLWASVAGVIFTVAAVGWAYHLGTRWHAEIPKLAILDSIEALELQRETSEAALDEQQRELAQLGQDLTNAQATIAEGERVQDYLNRVEDDLARRQAEIASLEGEKLTAERAAEAARGELEQLRQATERASEQRDSVRRELAQGEGEVEALEGRKTSLGETIERLSAEEGRLLEAISRLQNSHAQAGGLDDGTDSRRDLWEPCFRERESAAAFVEEKVRLEEMERQLGRARVRFSKRTLYAFHTALKVQDISPLTVLAGLSGTGKSLLPLVYSKCMGVKFLNLPVHPGWSSPQDLFGFYNYIEHSFKATPLARALVQFDGYNRGSWPLGSDDFDLSDQVLLVLLDEMNLARVEYYFSELLSRLETRRSIDPADPRDRSKCEIDLDIGHAIREIDGQREDRSVSLYPGDNVLFTGTMNEDESTMSLSDKVLDRATVLRFGRPSSSVSRAPDLDVIEAVDPLASSTWSKWRDGHEIDPGVESRIEELSEIMLEAGSPFGHRVALGMRRYVQCYPDPSLSGQRAALVDQIEQKILPKLRGEDLEFIDGPLRKLVDLAKDLNDQTLAGAIRAGQDKSRHGTFLWSGLDRVEE